MRRVAKNDRISINAIAGTHVVILGLNASDKVRQNLLGFSIERVDHTEGDEHRFLKNYIGYPTAMKITPDPQRGYPLQSFQWADFAAKPNHDYSYTLSTVYGTPDKPVYQDAVTVSISTEDETAGIHEVHFNRGAAAGSAYAERFKNLPPEKVPNNKAFKWLSRGLEEAMIAFISRANDKTCSLRGALYEFSYQPVLEALGRAAHVYGADVKVTFDNKGNDSKEPGAASRKAISTANIGDITIPRESNKSFISHNKFLILLRDNQPIEVWTGSTNITDGGIYGQSNVGHIVRDPQIAQVYYNYWEQLSKDPEASKLRKWNDTNTPLPQADAGNNYVLPVFSPRGDLSVLDWYAQKMKEAKQSVFLTAAFGVTQTLADVFEQANNSVQRYLLMESKGSAKDAEKVFDAMSAVDDNRIALCGSEAEEDFEKMLSAKYDGNTGTKSLNSHVFYVHTKYMLIDPLTDDPCIITGSANFSMNSTHNNDENMLVIRGDMRLADIYLGEFMRQFNHYYYRQFNLANLPDGKRQLIMPVLLTSDHWTDSYYEAGSPNEKERLLFAQTTF